METPRRVKVSRYPISSDTATSRMYQTDTSMYEGKFVEYRRRQRFDGAVPPIVREILALPGVEKVCLTELNLSVYRTVAVLWSEIEPRVFAAFRRAYPGIEVYGLEDEITLTPHLPLLTRFTQWCRRELAILVNKEPFAG